MAESASLASPVKSPTVKSPAKVIKKSSKGISLSSPKTFQDFAIDALVTLNDRKGLTRASLVKFIQKNHATELDPKKINNRLKLAINKLIEENRVTQDQTDLNWARSRFKLEKKFKEEARKLKKKNDETPEKVMMPKKLSAKKNKPKDETKKTKKATVQKKTTAKSLTPKKSSKEATPKKSSKEATPKKSSREATPKKAKTMKKN